MRSISAPKGRAAGALLGLACCVLAGVSAAETLADIEACLAANTPKRSSALTLKLTSRHREGGDFSHEGALYWRRSPAGRSESLICMNQPPAIRGLAYLVLEGESGVNLWGYLPEKQRVMQIHASDAARRSRIARTAIGYDDLRYLPLNTSHAVAGAPREGRIGERDVSIVELSVPPGEPLAYRRVVAFIDRERCVPLRTEFYEPAERMLKVMTADPGTIERVGDIYVARSLVVEDLKNGVRTELRLGSIEIDSGLPDEMFLPTRLQRNVCASH